MKVRGPAVAKGYFRGEGKDAFDGDGWFDTGDVATLDADGYMTITDRAKDVIKSGGEWISSIEIENIAVGHPAVAEAAVIGIPHPKWDERPLLIVVLKPGRPRPKPKCCNSSRARSPSGGCPTTSSSRTKFRTPQRAKSRRPCCASVMAGIARFPADAGQRGSEGEAMRFMTTHGETVFRARLSPPLQSLWPRDSEPAFTFGTIRSVF